VPFSADRRSFVDGFEQVDAAKRQRLSTVLKPYCAMLVPDWLEHGDEAKKHAGDSCFWV
jgi:hypothetical protein